MKKKITLFIFCLLYGIILLAQTVTNTNNDGPGSLRQAILDANANLGTDNISFNIPGTGPHTIQLTAALPEITDPVVIDGYTQPGAAPATTTTNAILMIELDGSSIPGEDIYGLHITSNNSLVKGLAIHDFYYAIYLMNASDNIISGNFIGTDITGTSYEGNYFGIYILYSSNNNTIGGTSPAERNIISGSYGDAISISEQGTNNKIQGNYIGTDVTGTKTTSSTSSSLLVNMSGIGVKGNQNTIGGTEPGAGNLISGTARSAIQLMGDLNHVQGNLIGTDRTGTTFPYGPNNSTGIEILWGSNNTIGGNTPEARNVISGNEYGITIIGSSYSGQTYLNVIKGNYIGTDITGTQNLGNDKFGISLSETRNNIIGGTGPGEANLIAYNGGNGIELTSGEGNSFLANKIYSNGGLGIDLLNYIGSNYKAGAGVTANDDKDTDSGGNGLQNYPVLTSVVSNVLNTHFEGNLNSTPQTTFTIQFFSSDASDPTGFGEGKNYLGETMVTTDASGNAEFMVTLAVSVPEGSFITSTATSSAKNTSEFSGTIVSTYVVLPVLSGIPADITVECDAVPVPAVVTAVDYNGNSITVILSEEIIPGTCANSYTLIRTWTATDDLGSSTSESQNIAVRDNASPVLKILPDLTIECDMDTNPTNTGMATATDNCDDNPDVSYTDEQIPGSCACNSTINRTWTATDACGNSSSRIQVITIVDTEPPLISCPADLPIECDDPTDPLNTGQANATDNCDGNPLVTYSDEIIPGSCTNEFTINRTWSAIDACGNKATATQIISVVDETKPVITGVPAVPITQGNDPGACGAIVTYPVIDAADNCSGDVVLSIDPVSGSFFPVGVTNVSVTATDVCGNTETASFDVMVTNAIPVIESITAPVDPVQMSATVYAAAVFTDNNLSETVWNWGDGTSSAGIIDGQNITGDHQYDVPGVYIVTLTITDICGETDTEMYQYIVIYDPNGGFVTGGGWIYSQPGAYVNDPLLEGKANFGFVSKYKKGTTIPDGNTEFQFKAGNLNFNSYSYDWLVIAGSKAKFKGTGTINGLGTYGFMISAIDGDLNGDGIDRFRIKIWDKEDNDIVVYDNEPGESDIAYPSTEIGAGSIVIHAPSSKKSSQPFNRLDNTGNNELRIYPNPFNHTLSIDLNKVQTKSIIIDMTDINGRLVTILYTGIVESGINYHFELNTSSELVDGFYILRVRSTDGEFYERELLLKNQ